VTESEKFPLVSIIIPAYNRAGLIGETLQSVKNQTYQNWECIVVDDGSTDYTVAIVKDFIKSENRIQLYKRDRLPKGAPACRNIGLQKSNGKYIIFLDSDDLMINHCIEERIAYFEKFPHEDFLVFQTILFTKEKSDNNFFWNIDTKENDLQRFLRVDAIWPICGPVYKKDLLLKLKGFREDLVFWQDYDLHLRALLLKPAYKKFLNLQPDILIRRHQQASVSQSLKFVSDKEVLEKRIQFFLFIASFVNERNIHLTVPQKRTLWSMLFYFSSALFIIHKDRKQFLHYWKKTKKALHINALSHSLSTFMAYLVYCRRFSIYFIKVGNIYQSLFKNLIVDHKILTRTKSVDRTYQMPEDLYKTCRFVYDDHKIPGVR